MDSGFWVPSLHHNSTIHIGIIATVRNTNQGHGESVSLFYSASINWSIGGWNLKCKKMDGHTISQTTLLPVAPKFGGR